VDALTSLSKSATSTWLSVSEIVLLLFGVLLVIGLVGEYRETLKRWVKVFEMFVIIGVAGELLADGGIFALSRHLEAISNAEIAALTQQTAVANQRAAEAEALAKGYEAQIATARNSAAQAEALAKGYEAQIASTRNTAAQANQKAEKEKLAREQLQSKMKARHLTKEQQAKLASILGDEPAQIGIFSQALDGESGDYADDFTAAFQAAKWRTFGPNQSRMTHDQGIEIGTLAPGTPLTKRILEKIQKAFAEVGVSARITYFSGDDYRQAGQFLYNALYLIIDHREDIVPADVRK
jgi:hypothetical protein